MTTGEPDTGHVDAKVAFFDKMDFHLVTEGPELTVVACSESVIALRKRSIIGLPYREAFSDLTGQQIVEAWEECYRTGEPRCQWGWRIQLELPEEGATDYFFDFVLLPWKEATGEVRGVFGRGTDVTAEVRARQRAEAERAPLQHVAAQDVVIALQDALLPTELPVLPRVDLAARYLLATEDTAAGGDWFDAVVRPTGGVGLVVGDVVGHGVQASAAMGQLRAVLHARLLSPAPVHEVLAGVDTFAQTLPEAHSATVCLAELDPDSGRLTYCTAGHPPPLLVSATGEADYLSATGAGPLATGSSLETGEAELAEDDLLLLYSDGVVERPGRSVVQNTLDLARVARDAAQIQVLSEGASARTVERVCQLTLELLTRVTGYADDITMLAAQRTVAVTPLELDLPADGATLASVRRELGRWLRALEVSPLDEMALQHAVGELVSNAVQHAYAGGVPAGVGVRAELTRTGDVTASVSDTGRWRQRSNDVPRRGLAMASGFVDEMHVDHDERGTVGRLRHRVTRSAAMLTGTVVAGYPAPGTADVPFAMEQDGSVLVVHGAVDLVTAEVLRSRLREEQRAGTRNLSVDMSAVTHLGSAGVRVLHEMATDNLEIVAPAGSAAQHVLEIVALPYTPSNAEHGEVSW